MVAHANAATHLCSNSVCVLPLCCTVGPSGLKFYLCSHTCQACIAYLTNKVDFNFSRWWNNELLELGGVPGTKRPGIIMLSCK